MSIPEEEWTGKGLLMKADTIADTFKSEVHAEVLKHTRPLKLVGILATRSGPSKSYAEFTGRQCAALGVEFVLKKVGSAAREEGDVEGEGEGDGDGVEEAIIEANEDEGVDGVMVYYPIFGGRQDHYLQQVVSPLKDVEGLNVKFHYNLYHNIRYIKPQTLLDVAPQASSNVPTAVADQPPPGTVKSIIPCTPLAIVKVLEYVGVYNKILQYGDRLYGKTVTIVNRSEVVGRPLAALLSNDGARVFSIDIDSVQEYTKRPHQPSDDDDQKLSRRYHPRHVVHACSKSLEECLALSDVVISAVPSMTYKIKTASLKDGCVCVNVSSEKNFEMDVREKASLYVPAVGKVTILMLLRNLLRLRQCNDLLKSEQDR